MNKINMIENFYNGNILTESEIDFYNNVNIAGDSVGEEIKSLIKKLYNLTKNKPGQNKVPNRNRIVCKTGLNFFSNSHQSNTIRNVRNQLDVLRK